ncbi:hypothetical protein F5880DRAFT_1616504 [Lentinula raphanica]|nr:hypothetical protein F5880DRAFT_1616504 [Lentinula raphanica]
MLREFESQLLSDTPSSGNKRGICGASWQRQGFEGRTATQPAFDFSAALLEAVCREGQGQELNDGLFQPAPTSLRPFPHSSPPSSSFASPLSSPLSSPPSPKLRSLPTLPAEETASSTPPNGSRKRRMKASSKRNRRKKRRIPREADGFSMNRRVIAVVVYPANETIQTAAEEAASLLRDLRPQASFTNKQNVTGVATFLNYLQALLMAGEERNPPTLYRMRRMLKSSNSYGVAFQRLSGFVTGVLKAWAPRLYSY